MSARGNHYGLLLNSSSADDLNVNALGSSRVWDKMEASVLTLPRYGLDMICVHPHLLRFDTKLLNPSGESLPSRAILPIPGHLSLNPKPKTLNPEAPKQTE